MQHLFLLLCILTSSLLFSQDEKVENPWSGNFDLGLSFTKLSLESSTGNVVSVQGVTQQ